MPTRDLPAHVMSIVTEIETEIGEEEAEGTDPGFAAALAPAAAIEGEGTAGALPFDGGCWSQGGSEPRVRPLRLFLADLGLDLGDNRHHVRGQVSGGHGRILA